MPSFLRKVGRYLGNLFRKQPQAPRVGQGVRGHRGIAAGRIAAPNLEAYAQRVARGHDEIEADTVEAFVNDEEVMPVHSSNVEAAQYFPVDQKMMVMFKGGASYLYSSVSPQEALSFAQASSKGRWVWQHLRVLGSRTAHRKPYTKVSGS